MRRLNAESSQRTLRNLWYFFSATSAVSALNVIVHNLFRPASLEKFSRDIEAHVPVLVLPRPGLRPAARDLAHRRTEGVREIQLKEVAAGALLDGEAAVGHPRPIPRHPRARFDCHIDGRPHSHACPQPDHERVV